MELHEIKCEHKIKTGESIARILYDSIVSNSIEIEENDIICIASKVVSISEKRIKKLDGIIPTKIAMEIHKKIPRKDPRLIQLMIDQSNNSEGNRLTVKDNFIGSWLPNGLHLTSGGIDKYNDDKVVLLPENPDLSARLIGEYLYKMLDKNISIIITDSDGRIDKKGATQVAIGLYGVPALRIAESYDGVSKHVKKSEETFCDMIAAASVLIMGQRGNNKPFVLVKGCNYVFNSNSRIDDALYNKIGDTL